MTALPPDNRSLVCPPTSLQDLDNDSLALCCQFLDQDSLCSMPSWNRSWYTRCHESLWPRVLPLFFARQGFSPQNTAPAGNDTRDKNGRTTCSSAWSQQQTLVQRRELHRALLVKPSARRHFQANAVVPHASPTCFPLRHDCFSFFPLLPDDEDWHDVMGIDMVGNQVRGGGGGRREYVMDPPPVHLDCDSFWLTSSATAGELLVLNPFTSTLSVCSVGSPLNQVPPPVAQQEKLQVLLQAQDYFEIRLEEYFPYAHPDQAAQDQEFELSFIGIEAKPVLTNSSSFTCSSTASLTTSSSPNNNNTTTTTGTMVAVGRIIAPDDEPDPAIAPAWVAAAAAAIGHHPQHHDHRLGVDEDAGQEPPQALMSHCTELLAWFRLEDVPDKGGASPYVPYQEGHVCRFRGGFRTMDICANRRVVFVNPWPPVRAPNQGGTGDWMDRILEDPWTQPLGGHSMVYVYPLVPLHQTRDDGMSTEMTQTIERTSNSADSYFPSPIASFECREPVTALKICPTGAYMIATTLSGAVQVWDLRKDPLVRTTNGVVHGQTPGGKNKRTPRTRRKPHQEVTSCAHAVRQARGMTEVSSDSNSLLHPSSSSSMEVSDEQNNLGLSHQHDDEMEEDSSLHQSAVEEIAVSRHLSIAECGFVTLQHSPMQGNTLLLWKPRRASEDDGATLTWHVHAMIDLPLMAQRIPKLHYDGRRIIVYGQDHIGLIVLIYHVHHSHDDVDIFRAEAAAAHAWSNASPQQGSGGVTNFVTDPIPAVRFANRIRHVALGGVEAYESLYMTCNERFIVCTTKTGNLVESFSTVSSHPASARNSARSGVELGNNSSNRHLPMASEGLLVIDLMPQTQPTSRFSWPFPVQS